MKAAILQTPGTLDLVELAIDKPAPREVLIRTVGSGLCHSDLHAIDAAAMPRRVIVPVSPLHNGLLTGALSSGGGSPVGWRFSSSALTDALISPSANQVANGSFQTRPWVKGFIHSSLRAQPVHQASESAASP